MPELPEVETVRRGLAELLPRRVVRSVTVFDSPKSFPNAPSDVEQFLYGAEIREVRRRAKVLIIDLDTDYSLVVHLKMTGQLVFRVNPLDYQATLASGDASRGSAQSESSFSERGLGAERAAGPEGSDLRGNSEGISDDGSGVRSGFAGGHPNDSLIGDLPDRSSRVQIEFMDGSRLFFNDQRKFGWVKLLPTVEIESLPFFQKVGPEPLDPRTKPEEFIQRIRRRNGSMVKPAILDQATVAGVGNIYADEGLWAAKIHPEKRVRELSDEQLNTLFIETVKVLALSIEKGGSTDKNYVDAKGRKGSYLEFANVFRREGQPCKIHPDVLIEKTRVAGRGTHICPVCQPAGGVG